MFIFYHSEKNQPNELSFCNKLKFSNHYSFATWWWKPLIFQTKTVWSKKINSLKYKRSRRMGCQVIGIRKSEFAENTHFLYRGWYNTPFIRKGGFFTKVMLFSEIIILHFALQLPISVLPQQMQNIQDR